MTKPTIGRVMWLKDSAQSDQFLTCSVAYVHGNGELVNIGGFDSDGEPFACRSVPVFQGDADECPERHVCWMPYQKAQAAKAEAEKAS